MYNDNPKKIEAIAKDVVEHLNYQKKKKQGMKNLFQKTAFQIGFHFLDQAKWGVKTPTKISNAYSVEFFISLKENSWKKFVDLTLSRMLHRGLFDHLDGGFFAIVWINIGIFHILKKCCMIMLRCCQFFQILTFLMVKDAMKKWCQNR